MNRWFANEGANLFLDFLWFETYMQRVEQFPPDEDRALWGPPDDGQSPLVLACVLGSPAASLPLGAPRAGGDCGKLLPVPFLLCSL